MRVLTSLFMVLSLAGSLPGCSKPKIEPQYASSTASPGYATRFPTELAALRSGYFDQEREVQQTAKEFTGYPDRLENPDWARVAEVYRHAEREGQSETYADRLEQTDVVRRFYEQEKDEIRKKVAGAVQFAAKKKNCEGDVASPAGAAMDKAFEERLEESLHGSSDAHTVVDDHAAALGPKNVQTLREQADAIARASYLAHIGVVRTKLRLRQMLAEAEQVEQTLGRAIEELKAQEKGTEDEKERARFAERRSEAEKARGRIEAERTGAKSLADEIEKRIEELGKQHAAAFDAVLQKVDARATSGGKETSRGAPDASGRAVATR
jgi:hypothetical protein